jgi:hypothetical protein
MTFTVIGRASSPFSPLGVLHIWLWSGRGHSGLATKYTGSPLYSVTAFKRDRVGFSVQRRVNSSQFDAKHDEVEHHTFFPLVRWLLALGHRL